MNYDRASARWLQCGEMSGTQGLPEGEYKLEFGGKFPNISFRQKITYDLTAV